MNLYVLQDGASSLTDDEVISLVDSKHIPAYQLEKQLDNHQRGVAIRYHCHTTEIKLKQNVACFVRRPPTKLFYFSFVSASRACESKHRNKSKVGEAGLLICLTQWQPSSMPIRTLCISTNSLIKSKFQFTNLINS